MSIHSLTLTPRPLSIAIATTKGFLSVDQPILKTRLEYLLFQIADRQNHDGAFSMQ